ncbi:MAG: hypothetical protein IKO81_01800 [Bacteroidales bacterium]|nr:hypothetical protein [Bacteroidales bacterium]
MKKTLFILAIVLCGSSLLFAQKPMKGLVSGGAVYTEAGAIADATVGMPFAGVTSTTGYTITSEMPFSHLKKVKYSEQVTVGQDYNDEYFTFNPVTTTDIDATNNPHRKYVLNASPKKYDVLAVLTLLTTDCGPGVTADYPGGNSYQTVFLQGLCWTKSNLKEEVAGSRVYDDKTDAAFIDKYGRLYTWYQAVGVAGDGSVMPTPDANGYVKGICPEGWHIPTGDEMAALRSIPAPMLNATTDWLGEHAADNTNATGFTAYPAGMYTASLERYEGLGSQTDWWSSVYTSNANITTVKVTEIAHYCDVPMEKQYDATNALSVRCVKNGGTIHNFLD